MKHVEVKPEILAHRHQYQKDLKDLFDTSVDKLNEFLTVFENLQPNPIADEKEIETEIQDIMEYGLYINKDFEALNFNAILEVSKFEINNEMSEEDFNLFVSYIYLSYKIVKLLELRLNEVNSNKHKQKSDMFYSTFENKFFQLVDIK